MRFGDFFKGLGGNKPSGQDGRPINATFTDKTLRSIVYDPTTPNSLLAMHISNSYQIVGLPQGVSEEEIRNAIAQDTQRYLEGINPETTIGENFLKTHVNVDASPREILEKAARFLVAHYSELGIEVRRPVIGPFPNSTKDEEKGNDFAESFAHANVPSRTFFAVASVKGSDQIATSVNQVVFESAYVHELAHLFGNIKATVVQKPRDLTIDCEIKILEQGWRDNSKGQGREGVILEEFVATTLGHRYCLQNGGAYAIQTFFPVYTPASEISNRYLSRLKDVHRELLSLITEVTAERISVLDEIELRDRDVCLPEIYHHMTFPQFAEGGDPLAIPTPYDGFCWALRKFAEELYPKLSKEDAVKLFEDECIRAHYTGQKDGVIKLIQDKYGEKFFQRLMSFKTGEIAGSWLVLFAVASEVKDESKVVAIRELLLSILEDRDEERAVHDAKISNISRSLSQLTPQLHIGAPGASVPTYGNWAGYNAGGAGISFDPTKPRK